MRLHRQIPPLHVTSHFCLQFFVQIAAVHEPVHDALSSQVKPQFEPSLQVMSHFDVSLQAMLHETPGAHASAQVLVFAQVSVHGDFVQVKLHLSPFLQAQAVPHSPLVRVAASPPASFGVPASTTTAPASTTGEAVPASSPSPTVQS